MHLNSHGTPEMSTAVSELLANQQCVAIAAPIFTSLKTRTPARNSLDYKDAVSNLAISGLSFLNLNFRPPV